MDMRHLHSLLALSFASIACSEEPPAVPSWDVDVYPILRGSCGHCHGVTARFGSGLTPETRYDICNSEPFNTFFAAEKVWITGFNEQMQKPNVAGASPSASLLAAYTKTSFLPAMRMPPPPADPLSDYQQTVLQRWVDAGRASCAKQTGNRKPEMKVISAAAAVPGTNKVGVTIEVTDPDGDQAFGFAKIGNAAPQTIPGSGRYRFEFDGVRATDPLTVKLFDGYDAGP
jgi:hypothetical protein